MECVPNVLIRKDHKNIYQIGKNSTVETGEHVVQLADLCAETPDRRRSTAVGTAGPLGHSLCPQTCWAGLGTWWLKRSLGPCEVFLDHTGTAQLFLARAVEAGDGNVSSWFEALNFTAASRPSLAGK